MANNTRTTNRVPGVIGALIIAGVLVGGAYTLANPNWLPFKPQYANAASTQQLLQEYAQKDSDSDGLPDWEEALYGTDPNNPHSVSPTLTDSEAVNQGLIQPKFSSIASSTPSIDTSTIAGTPAGTSTVTAQFAQQLFSSYIAQSNGSEPSQSDITTYVQSAMQNFVANRTTQNAFTMTQVIAKGSGATALTTYAQDAEQVFANDTVATDKSEVDYFADAVEKNDTSALSQVAAIGSAYTKIGNDYIKIPVPVEAQTAHLNVANALVRLGSDITDMSTMDKDPLRAYLGLSQYQQDAQSLSASFAQLYTVFSQNNVNLPEGTNGSSIYKTAKMAADAQTI